MSSPFVNQLNTRPKWRASILDRDCGGSTTAYWQGPPNWRRIFSIFKRMAAFVQADIERFVRRVNSQTETNDQEWCTSAGSPGTCALPPGAKNPNASFRLN